MNESVYIHIVTQEMIFGTAVVFFMVRRSTRVAVTCVFSPLIYPLKWYITFTIIRAPEGREVLSFAGQYDLEQVFLTHLRLALLLTQWK